MFLNFHLICFSTRKYVYTLQDPEVTQAHTGKSIPPCCKQSLVYLFTQKLNCSTPCWFLFYVLFIWLKSCGTLIPQPGIEPVPPAVEAWCP